MSLALAMILDAVFGEPRWLWDRWPHPAVLMGRVIGWIDDRFNRGGRRRLRGVLSFGLVVLGFLQLGYLLQALPGDVAEVVVGAVLLAQKSLVDHVRRVGDALRISLPGGRRAVAMIVSRDTATMDETAVARSALESAAENLSDGVVAPLFWFAVAGLPGLLVYKITNTADSMIGYRTERHEAFGWAAARFDDLLNLIPARLTALMFWLVGGLRGSWGEIAADARRHKSPNAGWPEAAMSRGLDVALAGPRSYHGTVVEFPFVNAGGRRNLGPDDIDKAVGMLWRVWAVAFSLVLLLG